MRIIENERIIFVDIDETLVMHDCGSSSELVQIPCRPTGIMLVLRKNENMIRLVKEEHYRGATIIVWSRGGYEWAADVITALRLEKYVDTVLSKPLVYFDDKPVGEWLKDRVYIGPDENYKSNTYKA